MRSICGFWILIASLLVMGASPRSFAQPKQEDIVSPEVVEDGRVIFRALAPKATEVRIDSGEIETVLDKPNLNLTKGDDGVWSLTVGPLPPGIYDYYINIDGAHNTDFSSPWVFNNRRGSRGYVEVPGPQGKPRMDEWRDVPHGAVTMQWYKSQAADGALRRIHVYTPPDYWKNASAEYPIVYLFHGSGDNDSHWMAIGRANVIADNLIAEGRMAPMIIVMPDGHVPVAPHENETRDAFRLRANEAFEKDVLNDVMPLVETSFRVKKDRSNRAVAGLSMGGGQSLRVGLNNLDRFAWIGAFSASARGMDSIVSKLSADVKSTNEKIKTLWIAIGKEDFLLQANHEFVQMLKDKQIAHQYQETEGRHQWSVWRRYLAEFLPLLFR